MAFIIIAAAIVLLYSVGLLIWRLVFHPLAGFPGPKLAAATGWYEAYFDLVKWPGGTFMFELEKMHDIYGPIVRINPHEIHIRDSDWVDKLYVGPGQGIRDKYLPAAHATGTPQGVFGTISHDTHRKRRAALSPFFSKAAMTNAESLIQSKADGLIASLEKQFYQHGYAEMRRNSLAFTTDVLCELTFNESMNLLLDDQKAAEWKSTIKAIGDMAPFVKQFVWTISISLKIPPRILMYTSPALGRFIALRQDMLRQARDAIRDHKAATEKQQYTREKNIFSSILRNPALPDIEKHDHRIAQEGVVTIAAGGETTARVLSTAIFFILEKQSGVLPRLLKELNAIDIGSSKYPTLKQLEQLPWLSAVVQESLRWTSLVTSRLPLVSPDKVLTYGEFVIPRGTPVSMNLRDVLHDSKIFKDPLDFKPERWLDENPNLSYISKYQIPFGRGSRMCIGLNLALAELYIGIARLFLAFDLELYETTRAMDVDIIRDCFVGEVHPDSKGIRVRRRQVEKSTR